MKPELFQNISNIIICIGIVLTALGSYGSYYFGNASDSAKDKRNEAQTSKLNKQIEELLEGNQTLRVEIEPFKEYAKKLFPSESENVALQKLRKEIDIKIDEAKRNVSELADATLDLTSLSERISKYDRTALDEVLKIEKENPNSEIGKYAERIIKRKKIEFKKYLEDDKEGQMIYSNFTKGYFKGVAENDIKTKVKLSINQIETSNHVLEVAWGFVSLQKLGYTEIDVFDFDKVEKLHKTLH